MLGPEAKVMMKSSINASDYIDNHRKIVCGQEKLIINPKSVCVCVCVCVCVWRCLNLSNCSSQKYQLATSPSISSPAGPPYIMCFQRAKPVYFIQLLQMKIIPKDI